MTIRPRYPIYVPSKNRTDKKSALTIQMFLKDRVPFYLVLEEEQVASYQPWLEADTEGLIEVLVLPFSNPGSVIPARNWIKQHATDLGAKRHWQFDDNIRAMYRLHGRKRLYCNANPAIRLWEDFTDRYTNVAISGFNYAMFVPEKQSHRPFIRNVRVYSSSLILNEIPNEWRGRYNEDTDLCLQVLADGWCTLLCNAFMVDKIWTMKIEGGNTAELYRENDGRLKMARSLERNWPGVVTTQRRFKRPQHVVAQSWRRFDNDLIRDPDAFIPTDPDEYYGLKLVKHYEPQGRVAEVFEEYGTP